MNRRLTILASILIACGTAGHAAGQQPQTLTLAEALDRAEKQNLDLQAARAQRAVALASGRIAQKRPNPTVFFGAARDTPHESLFFDQPIEISGKREKRIEVAKQESLLTESSITASERQVRREVRVAYFTLVFARRVELARDLSPALERRI